MQTETEDFIRPFPALSPAQRFYLDVNGYVVVPGTLTTEEVDRLLHAMYRLRDDLLNGPEPESAVVRGCRLSHISDEHLHFAHILETDNSILEYLSHPRLIGMAEELVGGTVRLEESEAVINRRKQDFDSGEAAQYGFHTGTSPDVGTFTENGLFHCNFVKTLTNLTELGPEDGGTVVIAGSHKIKAPRDQIIACAYEDRSLIHQVTAPAGSTLLFGESLIHATGRITSDRERVIIIGGYTPTMFQAWNGQEPSEAFVSRIPLHLRPLISGSDRWSWKQRQRNLNTPIDEIAGG
ncbi:MAG: hypothetical protein HOH43_20310 [Candidatus Latescibacteria bacterium]|nr:hypothetical protein [Candidatus Latescibacterota bacterium]